MFFNRIHFLKKHPIKTQAIMTGTFLYKPGIMAGMGDVIAQKYGKEPFDPNRTARQSLYALFFTGPLIAIWYRSLEKFILLSNPTKSSLMFI